MFYGITFCALHRRPVAENSIPLPKLRVPLGMSTFYSAAPADRVGAVPLFRRDADEDEEDDERPAHNEDEDDEEEDGDEQGDDRGDGYSE